MGYVRDTPDHGIIASLGVYNTSDGGRDPVRAVYWPKGAKRAQLVEYEGASFHLSVFPYLYTTWICISTPAYSTGRRCSESVVKWIALMHRRIQVQRPPRMGHLAPRRQLAASS